MGQMTQPTVSKH